MDDIDEMLDELEDIDYMDQEYAKDKVEKRGRGGCCLIPSLLIVLIPFSAFFLFHFLG